MSEEGRIEQILDAAYVCFTRHGVRRTTMDDIAREAGMSRPAVYQYVRGKDDAYRRLGARLLDASSARARAAAVVPGGMAERLVGILDAKLEMVLGLWRDSPAHAAELLGPDARLLADLIGDYDVAMRNLLAATVTAARPEADGPELAELLLAFARGLEADLSDPDVPRRLLRRGVALLIAGADRDGPERSS
ncbi:TetR/AcrR family transcriptional regulator [Nocardia bovistercoris]|uniref:TetR/AcrR family transcriptional regulator n=1 Tax=Nocardia bovistercoris TaxID=2785916 RepID=A0A931N3J2_9NOCA|nr:TetR/AcrR family transcriptional regulator [Nocardia bovistercoris]MBH0776618.1 TetR/AcrR family transcriptional regulator [Nocardia bovistercoris]